MEDNKCITHAGVQRKRHRYEPTGYEYECLRMRRTERCIECGKKNKKIKEKD